MISLYNGPRDLLCRTLRLSKVKSMPILFQPPQDSIRNLIENGPRKLSADACPRILLDFVNETDPDRKALIAVSMIGVIINPHGKPHLPDTLQQLYNFETMLRAHNGDNGAAGPQDNVFDVQRRSRDHVIHALNTYLLGLLLIEKLDIDACETLEFQWKIASLFHDIGYPLEIAKKLIDQSILNLLNELVPEEIRGPEFKVNFKLSRFRTLTTGENALALIQNVFSSRWDLEASSSGSYNSCQNTGRIKHGVISSLLVMSHIDLLYKKNNPSDLPEGVNSGNGLSWGRQDFYESIVPACAAIMLHDASMSSFEQKKIKKNVAPLAWLLRVCDALQDWDRPHRGNPIGTPSAQYSIGISGDTIHFKCPQDRIGVIKGDLAAIDSLEQINIAPV